MKILSKVKCLIFHFLIHKKHQPDHSDSQTMIDNNVFKILSQELENVISNDNVVSNNDKSSGSEDVSENISETQPSSPEIGKSQDFSDDSSSEF